MLNLNLKAKFKKFIPASMAFAALLTVAPLSSFAAETETPVKNNIVNFPQINYKVENVNQTVSLEDDGEVTAQGWKKSAVVWALRNGGDKMSAIVNYIGKGRKEAQLLKKYSHEIADELDSLTSNIENGLSGFMQTELGIPGGSARVIASCICAFIL